MRLLLIIMFSLVSGCAYTTSKPIDYKNIDSSNGFIYYDPKPLLLINDNMAEIKFIPNYEKAYAVKFNAFLAKNNVSLEMSNGLLTKMTSDLDTTGFLTFVQGASTEALKAGRQISEAFGEADSGGKVQIFEFEFDESGAFTGLKQLEL